MRGLPFLALLAAGAAALPHRMGASAVKKVGHFVLNEMLQQQADWPCKEVPCADEEIAAAISAYNAASNAYLQEKLGLSREELIELGAVVEV